MIEKDLEWLLEQPKSPERDHIEQILKEKIGSQKICPKCGNKGEMFTSDLDWCPKCHTQWPGT